MLFALVAEPWWLAVPEAVSSRLPRLREELSVTRGLDAVPVPHLAPTAPPVFSVDTNKPASPALSAVPPPPVESEADAARRKAVLSRIRYPWQELGYQVVFLPP